MNLPALTWNDTGARPMQPVAAEAAARRICLITSGHLSTCPRMLKAADSLAGAGYVVRVVSTNSTAWAALADLELRKSRKWRWACVDYSRETAPLSRAWCGLRFRSAQRLARSVGPLRCPAPVAFRAYSRVHPELVSAALAEPADLFYGGTTGALAAVAAAGRRASKPFALDLEDFHSAEQSRSPDGELSNGLAARIEAGILRDAAFLTAGSDAIRAAYRDKYGVEPVTINNTFPLPDIEPDFSAGSAARLRLYWFSQTIGPNRGLEDVIRAVGVAGIAAELHLRGRPSPGYLGELRTLASEAAPDLQLVAHEPSPPDTMVELCRGNDCGLAVEPGFCLNNSLALSNKALTYMLAGLAVVFTDTRGQRPLAEDLGRHAILYAPGDVAALAAGLRRWADNRDQLRSARIASWEAARRRWHWEHPLERGTLLRLVSDVFQAPAIVREPQITNAHGKALAG